MVTKYQRHLQQASHTSELADAERMAQRANPGGKKMKKLSLISLAVAAALVICPAAFAQSYDFTFTGAGPGPDATATSSGTLDVVGGVVTGLTGTFDSSNMTLLALNGYAGNDNHFFSSGSPSYFDFAGLSFEANSIDYNLAYDAGAGTYILNSVSNPVGYLNPNTPIDFSVPEGGAALLYLLLAGGACFGTMFFSRNRFANLASA